MTATIQRERQTSDAERRCGNAPRSGWLARWAWLVLLAGWVILAHGCHAGDHDDELAVVPIKSPE
jgi:hypothetical protein